MQLGHMAHCVHGPLMVRTHSPVRLVSNIFFVAFSPSARRFVEPRAASPLAKKSSAAGSGAARPLSDLAADDAGPAAEVDGLGLRSRRLNEAPCVSCANAACIADGADGVGEIGLRKWSQTEKSGQYSTRLEGFFFINILGLVS